MDDDDLPSKDIEKLIELWLQKECLWNISLERYHKKDLKGNQLTVDNKYACAYMHNFRGKEQQVMWSCIQKFHRLYSRVWVTQKLQTKVSSCVSGFNSDRFSRYVYSNCGNTQALVNKKYDVDERHDVEGLYREPYLSRRNKGGTMKRIARWLAHEPMPKTDG